LPHSHADRPGETQADEAELIDKLLKSIAFQNSSALANPSLVRVTTGTGLALSGRGLVLRERQTMNQRKPATHREREMVVKLGRAFGLLSVLALGLAACGSDARTGTGT